jgi:hypothetical protein
MRPGSSGSIGNACNSKQCSKDIYNFQDWYWHLFTNCTSAMQRQMIVLAYLGVSAQNFTQLGESADFFTPFYLSCLSGLVRFRDWSDKGIAPNFVKNLGENATET